MADLSLDEYILRNNIKNPYKRSNYINADQNNSKFDRFKEKDSDSDEEMEKETEMPNNKVFNVSFNNLKLDDLEKPSNGKDESLTSDSKSDIHSRLGNVTVNGGGKMKRQRNYNRNRNQNYNRTNFNQFNNNRSVQHRLDKNFVNPAVMAKRNIIANTINSMMDNTVRCMANGNGLDDTIPTLFGALLSQFTNGPVNRAQAKYDMDVQREIHTMQRKDLFYSSPGTNVVSFDGPGLDVSVRPSSTNMSLNQRFA